MIKCYIPDVVYIRIKFSVGLYMYSHTKISKYQLKQKKIRLCKSISDPI